MPKVVQRFDVILLITKKTPNPVNTAPLNRWFDGNDIDLRTGEQRLFYYDVPKTRQQIRQIAKKYHLKVDSIRKSEPDD